jgi:hypothetical protein
MDRNSRSWGARYEYAQPSVSLRGCEIGAHVVTGLEALGVSDDASEFDSILALEQLAE